MSFLIESPKYSIPFIISSYLDENKPILVEAPDDREAAAVTSALSLFTSEIIPFIPRFMLMEKGGNIDDIELTLRKIILEKPKIVVTSSASRRWILPEKEMMTPFKIKKGEILTVTSFVSTLSAMGYIKTPIVEDEKSFSVRGDILDIGIENETGIRIEFFDDEIERIAKFSLLSQRNMTEVDEVEITPLLFSKTLREDWKEKLDKLLHGYSSRDIMEIEEIIENGAGESYDLMPLRTASSTIENYNDFLIITIEKESGLQFFKETVNKLDKARKEKRSSGMFSPFAANSMFKETVSTSDVMISELFSFGEEITKFKCHTHKPDITEMEHPELLLKKESSSNRVVLLTSEKHKRFFTLTAEENDIDLVPLEKINMKNPNGVELIEGSSWFGDDFYISLPSLKTVVIPESIFSGFEKAGHKRNQIQKALEIKNEKPLVLEKLSEGEYLVHYNYGIGLFEGITHISATDCIILKYENDDKVYLPVYNMHLVHKYRWNESSFPKLSNIRTNNWEKTKNRVKPEIEKIAAEILELYASRAVIRGEIINTNSEMVRLCEDSFPYKETPDQLKSIQELYKDLSTDKVADRLLCGDVGFGKTEVAIRGAVAAVAEGKQAVILVPTTILALQHFQVIKERLADLPIKIEMLSRLYSAQKQKTVIEQLKNGLIDIVIGTHRIISKDVKFANLGFFVIDEEHRFGVTQKERIKEMKQGIDTLSMTATPIPRTLQLSLLGIREISFITTPPVKRKAVKTEIVEFSREIIREAIINELARDGQVYFVHNRIGSLPDIKNLIENLVPGITIAVAHGRMDEEKLETVMTQFVEKKYKVLLATSLIESGIDIPRVNTIIINRSDTFGLAQLYQLRGRVGRSDREAYAYLMIPSRSGITRESASRLAVIKKFDKLGSGYQVAMEDLNLRGGGNILGFSQSGKLKGIGYEMYLELLKQKIAELKGDIINEFSHVEIKSSIKAFIPDTYINETELRISFYRKISEAEKEEELKWMEELFTEMYGAIPEEVKNLFFLGRVRQQAVKAGITSLSLDDCSMTVALSPSAIPEDTKKFIEKIYSLNGRINIDQTVTFPIEKAADSFEILMALEKC